MPNSRPTAPSGNAIIVAVFLTFAVTVASAIMIVVAVEDGARAASLVTLILPSGAAVAVGLLALFKLGEVQQVVEQTRAHTTDLTNGKMDAKIRANVADVIKDVFLDPEAQTMIAEARRIRDQQNVNVHAEVEERTH